MLTNEKEANKIVFKDSVVCEEFSCCVINSLTNNAECLKAVVDQMGFDSGFGSDSSNSFSSPMPSDSDSDCDKKLRVLQELKVSESVRKGVKQFYGIPKLSSKPRAGTLP